ncbi:carbohydrate sulfotransferase 11-like isoform X2 [Palaemon carinicauda]|uniref:carbohydrate sulfotransferase 11-like isoform X2 n=1 Tax=Palaemon carinicauda TaxID=392227 RepID=UPI0035B62BC7
MCMLPRTMNSNPSNHRFCRYARSITKQLGTMRILRPKLSLQWWLTATAMIVATTLCAHILWDTVFAVDAGNAASLRKMNIQHDEYAQTSPDVFLQNETEFRWEKRNIAESNAKDISSSTAAKRLQKRRDWMQSVCRHLHHTEPVSKTARDSFNYFFDQRAAVCPIPKSGSSTWRKHLRIVNGGPHPSVPIYDDLRLIKIQKQPIKKIIKQLEQMPKIITVRHPLTRLVSCFRSKFNNGMPLRSYSPKREETLRKRAGFTWPENFFAFWLPALIANDLLPQNYHRELNMTSPLNPDIRYNTSVYTAIYWRTRPRINFNQFLKLVITSHKEGKANAHWDTYYNRCSPCRFNYDFVTQIETLQDDLRYVFSVLKIPSSASLDENSSRNRHKTFRDFKKFKWLPKTMLADLKEIVWPDLQMFGYRWPSILD